MLNVTEAMKHLNQKVKRYPNEQIREDLFHLLTRRVWLAQAWEEIRRNKGSQTAGINDTIAEDITSDLIKDLAEKLRNGKYGPKPVRRVYIPKANGKRRPLGIPTIEDRIVQQALRMILEPIFEAEFHECSHGFRKNRSTHTALRDTARKYANTNWIIEGDIEGCYDNIPHNKLMLIIGKRIADKRILQLIKRFLKAGYLENWQYHKTYSGTPQGGIISPLLANIFLHQLDEYMINEGDANKNQKKKEENARRNPEYRKIERQINKLRKKMENLEDKGRTEAAKELAKLEKQMKRTPYYRNRAKHPNKITYVRYADDFLILVNGTKTEAQTVKEKIKTKLEETGLTMSDEKTTITHWSKAVRFLGYDIKGVKGYKGTRYARLLIPAEKIRKVKEEIRRYQKHNYIPEPDNITQMSAVYRGWCNYYKYAKAPQKTFSTLASITWWSYAHYLGRKHRTSIKKIVNKGRKSNNLKTIERKGRKRLTFTTHIGKREAILDIFPPKTEEIKALQNGTNWITDLKPLKPGNWQSGRSLATKKEALERANGTCENCNENPVEHVHHRIPLRKKRSFLARVMSDKAQKETAKALCKECHLEIHGGSFKPKRKASGGNAGYAERCSSGVVNAS